MILDCHVSGCSLSIQKPYTFLPRNVINSKDKPKRHIKLDFLREQLVRADNIKWDPASDAITENFGLNSPTYDGQQPQEDGEEDGGETKKRPNKPWKHQHKKNKKNKRKYKQNTSKYPYRNGGPDANGFYDSYILVLRDPLPPITESSNGEGDEYESPKLSHDPNSFASQLAPFMITDDDSNGRRDMEEVLSSSSEYVLHLRDFNIGQTRRLARTAVSKINAYARGRRTNFVLRESRPVAWQGLVILILGIFSLVLCLLLGQFWEESDPTREGSYRKRMAEIKRRNEAATKLRKRRNLGQKPLMRGNQGPRAGSVGGAVVQSAMGGNARMRSNATANGGRRGGTSSSGGGVGYGAGR
jgi:hypothetical protein